MATYKQVKQKGFVSFYRPMEDYFDVCCQELIQMELIADTEEKCKKAREKYDEYIARDAIYIDEYKRSLLRNDFESYETIVAVLTDELLEIAAALKEAKEAVKKEAHEYAQKFKDEDPPQIKLKDRGHLRAASYLERLIHPAMRMPRGCWAIVQKVSTNKSDMDHYRATATRLRVPYSIVGKDSIVNPPERPPLLDLPVDDDHPNRNWVPNTCEFEESDSLTDLFE